MPHDPGWGTGLCSLVLAIGYDRDGDEPAIRRFLADQERLATLDAREAAPSAA